MRNPLVAILSVSILTVLEPIHAADVGYYALDKGANYVQTAATAPYLDPKNPYQITAGVISGTTGSLLLSSSLLTTPTEGAFYFTADVTSAPQTYELQFQQNFFSKSAMDTAFGSGTYSLSLLTTLPNQYFTQLVIGSDAYPPIPQITSMTNATWSGGKILITDPSQAVTLTWSGNANDFININNTAIGESVSGNSITIQGGTFTSGQYYDGQLQASNFVSGSNPDPLIGQSGSVAYQTQTGFMIQAGSPTSSKDQYVVEKNQVFTQTSNSAPTSLTVSSSGEDAGPFSFEIQSPAGGTVSGPSSTSYPLVYTTRQSGSSGGTYVDLSGPVSSQANLDDAYANGNYTFPDTQVVSLTGNTYPNTPQVTQVNGATPVWDAQGRVVLDPTVDNTLTWTSFDTESNPNWNEQFRLESDANGEVDLRQGAGLTTSSSTLFNTYVIPANTLTGGSTYTGQFQYLLASSAAVSGSTLHAAGYATEVYFSVLAQPAGFSSVITPSLYFQNGTSLGILSLNSTFLPSAWQGVGAMNSGWQEGAVGDITGNGTPAIIFQNGTSIGALVLNASGAPASWIGIGAMNAGWELRGAAYITGDGDLDLIFQNGPLIGYLEVNSSGIPQSWTGIGAMNSGWELRAVANLTASGQPDLIFQNGTSLGALEVNSSGAPISWNGIGALNTGWTLSSAVDVDGDGQPDLIFQNGASLGALQVNTSFQPISWHGIGAMGSGWVLPGDY